MKRIKSMIFMAGLLATLIGGAASANAAHKNPMVGYYKGTFDLNPLGNPRFEDLSFTLQSGGTVTLVTDEQRAYPASFAVVEDEGTALGTWKRLSHDRVVIGVVQFRNGNAICNRFGLPGMCTLRIGINATIDKDGHLTGSALPVVEQGANSFTLPVIPVDAQKLNTGDFIFP